MDDYIKRQAVIDLLYPVDPENDGSDGCTIVCQNRHFTSAEMEAEVCEIPAADVRQVVHGKWVNICGTQEHYCSECGESFDLYAYCKDKYNFCPNCGADMRTEG